MPESSATDVPTVVMLRAFQERLLRSVPFREDARLLDDLLAEAPPVFEVLRQAYDSAGGKQAGMHEGFALFNLLCRRAGLLAATPTASLAITGAVLAGLEANGVVLRPEQQDELRMIAVEGYSAGRDEQREQTLRLTAARTQVCCMLGPRCGLLFLAGAHLSEHLEQALEQAARELFRGDVRSVLLDVSRLRAVDDDIARAIVNLVATLGSLGTLVVVVGASELSPALQRLAVARHGAQLVDDFASALTTVLRAAGLELRQRRRLGDLIERVRSGAR